MRGRLVLVAWLSATLAACHGSSHGTGDAQPPSDSDGALADGALADAALPDGAPADAYIPAESHLLGVNDISVLLALPQDPFNTTTLVKMTGFPGGSELVPRDVFKHLVTDPGDVQRNFEEFHAVALRFDICDRVQPGSCPQGVDGRLRIVFQPLQEGNTGIQAADVALHAFYAVPAGDLGPFVNELRALARLQNVPSTSPLAVNTVLNANAAPSEYSRRMAALVSTYARADRLARLTLFAQDATQPNFNWVFRGVESSANGFADIVIPSISGTHQRAILAEYPTPTSIDVSPIADSPAGIQLAQQGPMFDGSSYAQRTAALGALAQAQNPVTTGFHTEQCIGCHTSMVLTNLRAADMNVDPTTIPGTFTSSRTVSVQNGATSHTANSLRAFGYFGSAPAISQRVANESALALDEIEQRYPPATTPLPDAGVPDAPPNVKHVFVTSAQFTGDLETAGGGTSGLDGADRLCAAAAIRGQLGGTYVAWLSTSSINASDRITGVGPWYLTDGTTLVFANKAALTSPPAHAIDHDETDAHPAGAYNAWTGTLATGVLAGTHTCSDWTSSSSTPNGMTGVLVNTDAGWTAYSSVPCNSTLMRLYCFEQ